MGGKKSVEALSILKTFIAVFSFFQSLKVKVLKLLSSNKCVLWKESTTSKISVYKSSACDILK